jgi:PAS domain S-box-containing protein
MSYPTSTSLPVPVGDLAARRILAFIRVLTALVVTALLSIDTIAAPELVVWGAGLIWLPTAAGLWFAEEGPARTRTLWIGIVLDLVVAGFLMGIAPASASTVMVMLVPFAAGVAYRSGVVPGAAFGAALLAVRWGVAVLADSGPIDPLVEVVDTLALVGVLLVVGRALTVQKRDARSVAESAQRSDHILERSSEGIVVTGSGGVIRQVNPAAERSLGVRDANELVGGTCNERLSLHQDSDALDCRRTCALAAMCHDDQGVQVWRDLDGVRQPLLATASRLSGQGEETQFLHSFRDITRLRQADEAKTMFLATASHELKTPLTVIRGFAQVLRRTVPDTDAQVALEAIETRSAELANIVDRLLLSSRIESGRVDLEIAPIDVSDILRTRMRGLSNSLGRTIHVDVEDDLLALASSDALITALDHLLDNAAKYSPGGQDLEITATRADGEIAIAVTDRGIGMTQEQLDQCFDRFWQAEATDVRRFGGTGIGLYIVESLVNGMNGRVEATSTLGQGTTFTVVLPVADGPDHVVDISGTAASAHSSVDEFMRQLGLPARSTG